MTLQPTDLLKLAVDPLVETLLVLVGQKELGVFIANISSEQFFKQIRIDKDGAHAEGNLLTPEQIAFHSQKLVMGLYELTSRTFSRERANEIMKSAYLAIKKSYDYETVAAYLNHIPKEFFEEERLTFLGREALEKLVLERSKELLKMKDEFVFIAAHDLRTPVTAISSFVSLINEQRDKLSADLQEDLDAVVEGTNRLKQLINDLLQVARSDSGTMKIELAPININTLIGQTYKELELPAQKRGISIELRLDTVHKTVMADEKKLSEVLENLFSNAVKYNKDKGKITVTTALKDKSLVLTIADTGLGIPATQQLKVFQKFFRADMDSMKNISGTGLGLFVVKMLVEKMGGTITFSSQEGVGTTFTINLVYTS